MINQRKWLVAFAAVVGVIAAFMFGVPLNTLFLIGALLLCPAAMYFGMQGMGSQQGCGHGNHNCNHGNTTGAAGSATENQERPKTA